MSYYSLEEAEFEVNLLHLQCELAKRLVIETIKVSHSNKISCIKFITSQENIIRSIEETEEQGVLYDEFPFWLSTDTADIENLVEHCKRFDGYYLVYLDLDYTPIPPFPVNIFLILLLCFIFAVILLLFCEYFLLKINELLLLTLKLSTLCLHK
ncbi:hypothetical protein C1645_832469 [Glomus cerebriforme]|uniref:Uncharacterized protein n=1 Tax=Glomus cerebriforme TaxID=658196 RepID=A0A397SDH1_9GLOM|nr:hypothetical protein C1645_832469 [Glomus cerebriforme]